MKRTPCVHIFVLFAFLINSLGIICPIASVYAQVDSPNGVDEFRLPVPGVMVHLSPPENPPVLKGITVYPNNPFKFDFILEKGDNSLPLRGEGQGGRNQNQLKQESIKLVKYFLASITTPENDLWVNLSPYEKKRIIPSSFGQTDMGRDLLAEDYILKQITASLIYPQEQIGKQFWKRVYEEAQKKFGTTNIAVNTFNKVWIVPDHAKVYEHGNTAFVVQARLKVMLEQDYLSLSKHQSQPGDMTSVVSPSRLPTPQGLQLKAPQVNSSSTNELGSQIVREIVIPQLETEVNEGKNFATLRQVYYSLILAVWFKKRMKDSILGRKYVDQNKDKGIHYINLPSLRGSEAAVAISKRTSDIDLIYQRYLKAFKKGVFNYIQEEPSDLSLRGAEGDAAIPKGTTIARKYFSGGWVGAFKVGENINFSEAMTTAEKNALDLGDYAQVAVDFGNAQLSRPASHAIRADDSIVQGLSQDVIKRIKATLYMNKWVYMPDIEGAQEVLESQSKQVTGRDLQNFLNSRGFGMDESQKKIQLAKFRAARQELIDSYGEDNSIRIKFFKKNKADDPEPVMNSLFLQDDNLKKIMMESRTNPQALNQLTLDEQTYISGMLRLMEKVRVRSTKKAADSLKSQEFASLTNGQLKEFLDDQGLFYQLGKELQRAVSDDKQVEKEYFSRDAKKAFDQQVSLLASQAMTAVDTAKDNAHASLNGLNMYLRMKVPKGLLDQFENIKASSDVPSFQRKIDDFINRVRYISREGRDHSRSILDEALRNLEDALYAAEQSGSSSSSVSHAMTVQKFIYPLNRWFSNFEFRDPEGNIHPLKFTLRSNPDKPDEIIVHDPQLGIPTSPFVFDIPEEFFKNNSNQAVFQTLERLMNERIFDINNIVSEQNEIKIDKKEFLMILLEKIKAFIYENTYKKIFDSRFVRYSDEMKNLEKTMTIEDATTITGKTIKDYFGKRVDVKDIERIKLQETTGQIENWQDLFNNRLFLLFFLTGYEELSPDQLIKFKKVFEEVVAMHKLQKNINQAMNAQIQQWMPSNEEYPRQALIAAPHEWTTEEKVDLNKLPPGSLVHLISVSWVNYLLEVLGNDKVKIWLNFNSGCYLGSMSLLGTDLRETGILKKKAYYGFPYFSWDEGRLIDSKLSGSPEDVTFLEMKVLQPAAVRNPQGEMVYQYPPPSTDAIHDWITRKFLNPLLHVSGMAKAPIDFEHVKELPSLSLSGTTTDGKSVIAMLDGFEEAYYFQDHTDIGRIAGIQMAYAIAHEIVHLKNEHLGTTWENEVEAATESMELLLKIGYSIEDIRKRVIPFIRQTPILKEQAKKWGLKDIPINKEARSKAHIYDKLAEIVERFLKVREGAVARFGIPLPSSYLPDTETLEREGGGQSKSLRFRPYNPAMAAQENSLLSEISLSEGSESYETGLLEGQSKMFMVIHDRRHYGRFLVRRDELGFHFQLQPDIQAGELRKEYSEENLHLGKIKKYENKRLKVQFDITPTQKGLLIKKISKGVISVREDCIIPLKANEEVGIKFLDKPFSLGNINRGTEDFLAKTTSYQSIYRVRKDEKGLHIGQVNEDGEVSKWMEQNPPGRGTEIYHSHKISKKVLLNFVIQDTARGLQIRTIHQGNLLIVTVVSRQSISQAMNAAPAGPGGIDLTAKRMNLEVEKDKGMKSQPMDLKVLENIEIDGLYIKDIEIKDLKNLPQLLGVASQ